MKSLFDIGFRTQFMPMPLRRRALGQDDSPFITSYDQGPASSGDIPGMYTSYDEGPASSGVPGLVTRQDLQSMIPPTPSAASSTNWGKVLTDMTKAGAATYSGFTKEQVTKAASKQKAGLPTGLPGDVAPVSSGINSNVVFIVGGLALATIVAVIATV